MHNIVGGQAVRFGYQCAVQIAAVGAVVIPHDEAFWLYREDQVMAGNLRVIHHDGVIGGTSDGDLRAFQREETTVIERDSHILWPEDDMLLRLFHITPTDDRRR